MTLYPFLVEVRHSSGLDLAQTPNKIETADSIVLAAVTAVAVVNVCSSTVSKTNIFSLVEAVFAVLADAEFYYL